MPSSTSLTKGARGDFGWMFRFLSTVMTTLAIVALARHAFVTWSLSAPMARVMDAYNAVMQTLFGWAQPYLEAALRWLGGFIGWHPTLHPQWRDFFVVAALSGAGLARAEWHADDRLRAFLTSTIITVAAFIAALIVGVLPLDSESILIQMLIAASFGVVLFGVVFFAPEGVILPPHLALSVIAALATWLLSLAFGNVAGLGLAGLAVAMVFYGIFFILVAIDEPLGWVVARTILGGFAGAFCFFAIDAGLKLLME